MLVSVVGFNPSSDMPPADGRRAERNTVSKCCRAHPQMGLHAATRTLEAFLNIHRNTQKNNRIFLRVFLRVLWVIKLSVSVT